MRLASAITVICCCLPLPARAEPLPITFRATPGCGTRAEFEARLRERSSAVLEVTPRAERLEVGVVAGTNHVSGRLLVTDGQGRESVREITAGSCPEAIDALALVAALALQRDPETPPAEKAAPVPQEKPVEAPPPVAATETAPRVAFDLTTSGLLASGTLPDILPMLELGAGVWLPDARAFARLSARLSPHQSTSTDAGTVTFEWWTAAFVLCPRNFALSQQVAFAPYAVGELGRLSASGSQTENPRSEGRTWVAAGVGAMLRGALLPPLSVEIGGEGVFPLIRDRFLLGQEVVHEIPVITARARLGLTVQFE